MYDRHLASAGLSVQQFSILSLLSAQQETSIAALADQMVMERTTLVRALKPLQQAGLLLNEAAGARRSFALTLTPEGRQKLRDARPLWRRAQREFQAQFGKPGAERLREQLKTVFAA
jgi:DNA-binding MarR family transcriptional regulator